MKQYILTCVNEDKEVVSTQAFATLSEAQEQMKSDYSYELKDYVGSHLESGKVETHSAHIYTDFNTEYHWEISNIDIPDATIAKMARNIPFVFRDDISKSAWVKYIFMAIFGKDMGRHIYSAHYDYEHPWTFIFPLDGGNLQKFTDYLLNPHEYRRVANHYYWYDEVMKDLVAMGCSSIDLCRVESHSKFPNVGVGDREIRWVGLDDKCTPRFESNNVHAEGTDPMDGIYEEYTWDELTDAEKEGVRNAIRAYRKAKGSGSLLPE